MTTPPVLVNIKMKLISLSFIMLYIHYEKSGAFNP